MPLYFLPKRSSLSRRVPSVRSRSSSFIFNYPATTEIYTLSLHDALPICQDGDGMGSRATGRRRRRSYVSFHGNRTTTSLRSDTGADSAHAGSSVGRSRSCLAGLEITTPQGAEQINRPDARIGWEGIGLMQFVVVVPEFATVADCYTDAKVLMRPVC